eukprot:3422846-Rhodomonas_salina.1
MAPSEGSRAAVAMMSRMVMTRRRMMTRMLPEARRLKVTVAAASPARVTRQPEPEPEPARLSLSLLLAEHC